MGHKQTCNMSIQQGAVAAKIVKKNLSSKNNKSRSSTSNMRSNKRATKDGVKGLLLADVRHQNHVAKSRPNVNRLLITTNESSPRANSKHTRTLNTNNNNSSSNQNKINASKCVCSGCNERIADRYLLSACDKYWHENCLKCDRCKANLGELGSSFYIKSNMNLCRQDYLEMFGRTAICSVCDKLIYASEMVMRAKQNVYHLECFACQLCGQRFCVGDKFYLFENKIVCQYDFEEHIVPIQNSLHLTATTTTAFLQHTNHLMDHEHYLSHNISASIDSQLQCKTITSIQSCDSQLKQAGGINSHHVVASLCHDNNNATTTTLNETEDKIMIEANDVTQEPIQPLENSTMTKYTTTNNDAGLSILRESKLDGCSISRLEASAQEDQCQPDHGASFDTANDADKMDWTKDEQEAAMGRSAEVEFGDEKPRHFGEMDEFKVSPIEHQPSGQLVPATPEITSDLGGEQMIEEKNM